MSDIFIIGKTQIKWKEIEHLAVENPVKLKLYENKDLFWEKSHIYIIFLFLGLTGV